MDKSHFWEVNIHAASQEIPFPLWNLKVHYCVHRSPPLIPTLSQMNPVHTFPPYFPKIHSDVILPSIPGFSNWSLPFWFPNQNTVCTSHLPHACYLPRQSYTSLFYHPNNNGSITKCNTKYILRCQVIKCCITEAGCQANHFLCISWCRVNSFLSSSFLIAVYICTRHMYKSLHQEPYASYIQT